MLSDFFVIGETACFQFREDSLSVDADFKPAAVGGNQYQLFQACFELGDELIGQTDRFGFVVSRLAVHNFDFHHFPSWIPSHKFFN